MISTIILTIGFILEPEREKEVLAGLQQKIRYVSDERVDALQKITANGDKFATDWNVYMGTADHLEVDAFIKYFMSIKLFSNDHMQLFIAREGPTNFESYWNGGGDAQTQFRGNANWKRGK